MAEKLRLIANLMTLGGGTNIVWKTKAYTKAAEILAGLDIPAQTVADFRAFPGIGESTASTIEELVLTGTCSKLESLRKQFPKAEEAFNLTVVPGVGVKKAIVLYNQGITNLQELALACESGKVSNEQIGRGVKLALRSRGRLAINEVVPVVNSILETLRALPEVSHADFAGSVRRGSETVKDVDIIVVSSDPAKTSSVFLTMGETLIAGEEKARIMAYIDARTSVQVDLLYTSANSFGSALAYFTGSKEHNIALRRRANDMGHTINEHGFFSLTGVRWGGASEQELYQGLGLPWCPPELREGDELRTSIPDLITAKDIYGDFHSHSIYSADAVDTILSMALAAQKKGLKVLGLTDHTEAGYKWNPETIPDRIKECLEASEATGVSILAGCETGVNKDGTLDWPKEYLDRMDYVIASIHRSHSTDPVQRLIAAIKQHPKVRVIGHPTGRMLGKREVPEDNWQNLFKACAEEGVLVEINGARLDLPVNLIKMAKEEGCKFVLNSDAHATDQLHWQDYAILLARRAGLTKEDLGKPEKISIT